MQNAGKEYGECIEPRSAIMFQERRAKNAEWKDLVRVNFVIEYITVLKNL